MDTATLTYLVKTKIKYVTPITAYDPIYKQRILDLTNAMLDNKIEDTLKQSFENYISDCIDHLKKDEMPLKKEVEPMKWDELMFVPKKVTMMVQNKTKDKNKNMFLKHDRT